MKLTALLAALFIGASAFSSAAQTTSPVDLGTLGGHNSFAIAVNASGQVAGNSETGQTGATGASITHAFLWTPSSPGGTDGTMVDLGTLGGGNSFAVAVNASGQVAGNSETGSIDAFGRAIVHAFLWTPASPGATTGTMTDLGTLGGSNSTAAAVNASGQVAGNSDTGAVDFFGGPASHAFLWTPTAPGATTGAIADLGTLEHVYYGPGANPEADAAADSYAFALNDSGVVVGDSLIGPQDQLFDHAYLWSAANGMQDLGTLNGFASSSAAYALNAAGQVAGYAIAAGSGSHAALWSAQHAISDLGALPGDSVSFASGVNAIGWAVGQSEQDVAQPDGSTILVDHATAWPPGMPPVALSALLPDDVLGTFASGINANGQVVGYGYDADGASHAFSWTAASGMSDLGAGVPGTSQAALALNDAGQIVGWSRDAGADATRAVLWPFVNTPAGSNVTVTETQVTVTFSNVTAPGVTTVTVETNPPPFPAGMVLAAGQTAFDISTTAVFAGSVTVCLDYGTSQLAPRLEHYENGAWQDVTTTVDTAKHDVCGTVTALSPFAALTASNHAPVANAGPDLTLECCGRGGTAVTLDGSASADPDGDALTFSWTDQSGHSVGSTAAVRLTLGRGEHLFTLTVHDTAGASSSDTVRVVVRDTKPPVIWHLAVRSGRLWPRDDRMVAVVLKVDVSDVCDPTVTCRIVAVSSNDIDDGRRHHHQGTDWKITGPLTLELRAEREGGDRDHDRVRHSLYYEVTVQCTDSAGNAATKRIVIPVGNERDGRNEHDVHRDHR